MQSKTAPKAKPATKRTRSRSVRHLPAAAPAPQVNQAAGHGVRIVDANVDPSANYWQVTSVRHLSADENRGKHNVYVDTLNEAGHRERNPALRITWTWEGRKSNEPAPPAALDKGDNEPMGNVAVEKGQHLQLWIEGDGLPSERVENLHTDHDVLEKTSDGQDGNTRFHHSYHIVFQRSRKSAVNDSSDQGVGRQTPPSPQPPTPVPDHGSPSLKPDYYPDFIFGLHEPGGEQLMIDEGRHGWVLALASVGLDGGGDPSDFSRLAGAGLGVVVRLHNGYEPVGSLPKPQFYPQFAQACATFVARSRGCHVWIIGNEPNHAAERPEGEFILPRQYAEAYRRCRAAIKALPGHANDQVLVAGPAPWNAETRYPENTSGDWAKYFGDTLAAIPSDECDGFAIHAYTHFHDPSKIKVDIPFNADGYRHLRDEFRSYRDFMAQIPARLRHLPVLISECDPTTKDVGWADGQNNGWVRQAYEEIADWNSDPKHQPIQGVLLYRWPQSDQHWWTISTRQGVIEDFKGALRSSAADRYRVRMPAATMVPAAQQLVIPLIFNNQDMINAFASAENILGVAQWSLLGKAGFDVHIVAQNRTAPFPGPTIDKMAALTANEKTLLQRELLTWLVSNSKRVGLVNAQAGANLRTGSSTSTTILKLLTHEAVVQILGKVDEWFFVFAQGEAGYLHQSLLVERVAPTSVQPVAPTLQSVQPIVAPPNASWEMLTVINTWNQFGDQIATLAKELTIDPGVAVAVLAAESGGLAFAKDGRMIIRFENHIFFDQWGRANPDRFQQHFRYDPIRLTEGHQWNPGDGNWRQVHTNNQESEWAAFNFARSLDERAAMASISMGTTQIMGFNHGSIGYPNVQAMFNAFQSDLRNQVQGFFDFVRAQNAVAAIRSQNFFEFARIYNGPGNAANYEKIIRRRLDIFQQLMPTIAAMPEMAMPSAMSSALPAPAVDASVVDSADWKERLLLLAQLNIIQQSYLLRLAALADPASAQQSILDAANDAIRQISALRGAAPPADS